MKKILLVSAITFFAATSAFAGMPIPFGTFMGTEDVDAGVLCKVKDVSVIAATAEDCTKIAGQATHQYTRTAKPITK